MTHLQLSLLGIPRIEINGEAISLDTRKAVALLAYLAISRQRHGRDALVALFWPESDRTRGRAALRRTLSPLNSALRGRWLEADNETIALRPDADFWLDVAEFHRQAAQPRTHGHEPEQLCDACMAALAGAVALSRDDFMAGFTLADCPEFDNWQTYQRESLRRELAEALAQLVHAYSARRQYTQALAYAQRWLLLDALHEPAHRQLMLLHVWAGDRAAALRQYETCVRVLDAELGVPPMEETRQLYCAIAENQAPRPPGPLTAQTAAAANGNGHGTTLSPQQPFTLSDHLPARLTSFIGRAEDVRTVARMLSQVRLVTLTGSGGCGKTSLAVETARVLALSYTQEIKNEQNDTRINGSQRRQEATSATSRFDDARLVELLPLTDPSLLAQAIVTALGVEGNPQQGALQTLISYLAPRQMLLILDNCEHLIDATAHLVQTILRSCPRLCVLITSRERLNIAAETVYPVQPLALPDTQATLDAQDAAAYPAVQLFVERSKAVRPSFELNDQNVAAVLKVCSLLDGIPLALELGAAAMATFTVAEIAEQLDARVLIAESGYRTADPRHHSLGDTVEWSYMLLSPSEQRVLVHLAVFVGGWTLEAMQQVVNEETGCAHILQQLVRKSLVGAAPFSLPDGRRMRYQLLRAIREYAAARLATEGEQEDVHRRHFSYYSKLAIQLGDQVMGAQHHRAMAGLDADYYNIRAAAQFALSRPDLVNERLRMAASLTYYWRLRSHTLRAEGLTWLETSLEPPTGCSPSSLAVAYGAILSLGCIDPLHSALNVGAEWHGVRRLFDASRVLLQDQGLHVSDPRSAGRLLLALADAHRFPGGLAKCGEYAAQAVELLETAGDLRGLGFAHNILTWVDLMENRIPAAHASQAVNLRVAEASGSSWAMCEAYRAQIVLASTANNHDELIHYMRRLLALAEQEGYLSFLYDGFHWLERIDEPLAVQMAEELVQRQRRNENSAVLGLALHQLGRIYVNTRQFTRATTVLDEAIEFWRRMGEQGHASALQWSLVERANASLCLGEYATARRCCEESLALFAALPFSDGEIWPRFYLGHTLLAEDDLSGAERNFGACIRIVLGGYPGWQKLAIWSLPGLGEIAYRQGKLELAGKLFGAAAALDASLQEPAAHGRLSEVNGFLRTMAVAEEYRRDPIIDAGWLKGEKLSLTEVVELALGR
jgi:predicted ATPase/DNA-binding SARP family transcriptional activator/tetratricopeptide (TPR) repeat protein